MFGLIEKNRKESFCLYSLFLREETWSKQRLLHLVWGVNIEVLFDFLDSYYSELISEEALVSLHYGTLNPICLFVFLYEGNLKPIVSAKL